MSNEYNLDDLPEGVYIDSEAMAKAQEEAKQAIVAAIVDNTKEVTNLIACVDAMYVNSNIPLFIREQAAQRLGDILFEITLGPIQDELADL